LPACSAQHISWQVVELPEKKSVTNFCNVHPQIVTAGMHPMHVEEREAAALQPEILTKNQTRLLSLLQFGKESHTHKHTHRERERERERERSHGLICCKRSREEVSQ